jgi:WD40 repeat protein
MQRTSLGWLVIAASATFVWTATPTLSQDLPPTEPILRIETGMHTAQINGIGIDSDCRLMVTASDDKTARLWRVSGDNQPTPVSVLRPPIGPGDQGQVFTATISPDGAVVAIGGSDVGAGPVKDNGVYIFDSRTTKIIRRLGGMKSAVLDLKFSPDGKYLAGTFASEGLRVWETSSWGLAGEDGDYGGSDSHDVAFDSTGRVYTVANDGAIRRYGPGFKLETKSKALGGNRPYSVAIHPNNDRVAVGFTDSTAVEVYSARDLKFLFAADTTGVDNGTLSTVAWSGDGSKLYAAGQYQAGARGVAIRIWDKEGRDKGRDLAATENSIVELLPCHDMIAVGALDPAFGLLATSGEKRVWQKGFKPDMRNKLGSYFTIADDGGKVHFGLGLGNKDPVLFDILSERLTDYPQSASKLTAPDVASLKLSDWKNSARPMLDSKPLLRLDRDDTSRSLAIAPGGGVFALGTDFWLVACNNDGTVRWRKPVSSVVWGVNISRNGKFILAAYDDGTIRWHRLSDGEEVLALFVNAGTREWVLWTPQGYYTSSVNGDQMVGWHLNKGRDQAGEFVTAARLRKHLYRPDIVKRAFELADADAAVREAGLSGFKLADLASHTPPEFRIVDPGDKSHPDKSPVAVRLELGATNDPVTGFDIKVNGRQVTPRDVRDIDRPTKDAETRTLNVPMQKGENHIQVVAHNGVGDTVQDLLLYLDHEGVLDRKGRLFIVAVGVDRYTKLGDRYTLRYAGADAYLMVDTLTKKAGPLHTEVISKLLVTDGDTPPTKSNIEDALAVFRDATPEDTVILFIASHGVNDGADYLMVPEDAERNDVGRWRPSSVVSWNVLQKALQDAQGSRIMFVDTCHSSGAYNSRLVKDAGDANIVVFSATDKDTEAQETSKLGHGVFTYALSQGLSGEADPRKKGSVSIFALSDYVSDEVKRMTNDEQEPVFSGSGVKNFVLATP